MGILRQGLEVPVLRGRCLPDLQLGGGLEELLIECICGHAVTSARLVAITLDVVKL